MWQVDKVLVVIEYWIGIYVYNDWLLQKCGVCDWSDCVLMVLVMVVFVLIVDCVVIDVGSKVLMLDLFGLSGYGYVFGCVDIRVDVLLEEYGVLCVEMIDFQVGDCFCIVFNYVCVVSNMVDEVQFICGDWVFGLFFVFVCGKVI